jgi:hypothetical protein
VCEQSGEHAMGDIERRVARGEVEGVLDLSSFGLRVSSLLCGGGGWRWLAKGHGKETACDVDRMDGQCSGVRVSMSSVMCCRTAARAFQPIKPSAHHHHHQCTHCLIGVLDMFQCSTSHVWQRPPTRFFIARE